MLRLVTAETTVTVSELVVPNGTVVTCSLLNR